MTVYTAAIASYFFDILLRFRIGDVGLVADIKQVILKIEIDEGYKDFLRFLWVEKIYQEKKMVASGFLRVVLEVASSPILLEATKKSYVTKYIFTQISQLLKLSKIIATYVC